MPNKYNRQKSASPNDSHVSLSPPDMGGHLKRPT